MSSACRPISWNGVACFGALVYTFQIYFEFFSYRWNPRARGENLLAECDYKSLHPTRTLR